MNRFFSVTGTYRLLAQGALLCAAAVDCCCSWRLARIVLGPSADVASGHMLFGDASAAYVPRFAGDHVKGHRSAPRWVFVCFRWVIRCR